MDIKFLLIMVVVVVCLCPVDHKEGYTGFDYLMSQFSTIFPDNNRNAGGPQFYHHIHKIKNNLTKEEYLEHNKHYCAVSGSPIDPTRTNKSTYVVVNLHGHKDKKVFGEFFLCCWPCRCDVARVTEAESYDIELKDGIHSHHVLTIPDPCKNEGKIPKEVTSFNCDQSITQNGIRTDSGRLIIGILHDSELYDENNDLHKQHHDDMITMCQKRNDTPVDQLQGGMGDIFVKVATI